MGTLECILQHNVLVSRKQHAGLVAMRDVEEARVVRRRKSENMQSCPIHGA